MINFKFNFTFHNILIYCRATFNYRVACCVDFRESWLPVEVSWKEYHKISVLKIPPNRKICAKVYVKSM